jgi:Holliday junction resolvasome RuvABC ATP-dependent DNA helicase subunit
MNARSLAMSALRQPFGAALWARCQRLFAFIGARAADSAHAPETSRQMPAAARAPVQPRAAANPMAANQAFTPTRPRAGRRALVGRQTELNVALQALTEEAAHVVLYSERGRGKTSLANLVVERLRRGGVVVGRHACNADSDFDQIIRGLLRDLPPSLLADNVGAANDKDPQGGCASVVPDGRLLPADIAAIPGRLACGKIVFVVDEFDRVTDGATRTRLADTIKMLSDRGDRLLFMTVGVSTTLEHIIGQHPSIERNITALHLPLLSDAEITEMLTRGGAAAGVDFTDAACSRVAGVARGMPYMAQLLGLRITQAALMRGASTTSPRDVTTALHRLLDDVSPETASKYVALTNVDDGARIGVALLAVATAAQDKWGRFALPNSVISSPDILEKLIAAEVLRKAAGAPELYQYADRTLIYHVLLRAAHSFTPGADAPQSFVPPEHAARSTAGASN